MEFNKKNVHMEKILEQVWFCSNADEEKNKKNNRNNKKI